MANTTYQQLLHSVALRMNALVGAQFAPLQTTYVNTVLTSANFKSADWPFDSFKDAILMAEEDFANAIANCGNHPWRAVIATLTGNVANGSLMPSQSAGGRNIIGIYGTVQDSADGTVCTEQPLEVIRRVNQETWRKMELYNFKFDGSYLYHTRTTVKVEVCVYDRSVQKAAFDANTAMLLPEPNEPGIVARAVSLMCRTNAHMDQARVYREYSNDALAMIVKGLTSVPPKSVPGPTLVETAG